ncbi:hypothetical protein [Paractinoplanes durhamensis]
MRFRGATTVRVDGYLVSIEAGETRTVVSTSGEYEIIQPKTT